MLMPWIEAIVASSIILTFVLQAMLLFKDEHVEHHPGRVYAGAALQGMILGLLVGFVILPLRFAFFVPDAKDFVPDAPDPPVRESVASLSIIPIFIFLLVVRRGLLARVPIIGRYLRAYRRAALKWQIDGASKALTRLEAIDDRKGLK